MRYNWQQKDWPNFQYETASVMDNLFDFAQRTGRISGVLEGLSKSERTETMINLLVLEAIKTSEIEGEYLSRNDVMSSIRRNLGLNPELPLPKDKRAERVAELMLAVQNDFLQPLTNQICVTCKNFQGNSHKGFTRFGSKGDFQTFGWGTKYEV